MPIGVGLRLTVDVSGGNVGWWLSESALDLDFSNNRAFNSSTGFNGSPNGILTYTSPSPKLVYGNDGVLGYAPHNLLLYSEAFSNGAYWLNGVISASGTRVNGSVSVSADNGYAYVRQNFTAINKECVASFEVICDTTVANVPIVFSNGTTNYPVVTSLVAGVPQRVTSPVFSPAAFVSVGIDLRDAVAPGGSNTTGYTITFNKAQLQLYPNHDTTTYIPTTSAARYSFPIDHDPITLAPLGVLIEEQRTNLLLRSEQFDNAAWTKGEATVSANATTSPNGTASADKLVESVNIAEHYVLQAVAVVSGTTYTCTVFAKAGERSWLRVFLGANIGNGLAWVNLATGAVGTTSGSPTVKVTDVGGGWYRIAVTKAATGTGSTSLTLLPGTADDTASYDGDGTSGLYLWGAQLEAGAFATSYIPTVASQVTRAADQVSILTSAFAYTNVCSVLADADCFGPTASTSIVYELAATARADALTQLTFTTANQLILSVRGAAFSVQAAFSKSSIALSTFYKVATALEQNNFANSFSGEAAGTDTSGTWPASTITKLAIGGNATGYLNGHIKRLTYFPTRKTNAELQALSA